MCLFWCFLVGKNDFYHLFWGGRVVCWFILCRKPQDYGVHYRKPFFLENERRETGDCSQPALKASEINEEGMLWGWKSAGCFTVVHWSEQKLARLKKKEREQPLEQLGEERLAATRWGWRQGGFRARGIQTPRRCSEKSHQHIPCKSGGGKPKCAIAEGWKKLLRRKSGCWQALAGVFQDKLLLLAGERRELSIKSRRQYREIQCCIKLLATRSAPMLNMDPLCLWCCTLGSHRWLQSLRVPKKSPYFTHLWHIRGRSAERSSAWLQLGLQTRWEGQMCLHGGLLMGPCVQINPATQPLTPPATKKKCERFSNRPYWQVKGSGELGKS